MFSQSSAFHTPDNAADRMRSPLSHSTSQTSLHGSFSIGGMASTTGAHHPHGTTSWASNGQGSALSNPLNDPFLQSRSSYQSGYLMVRPFRHCLCLPCSLLSTSSRRHKITCAEFFLLKPSWDQVFLSVQVSPPTHQRFDDMPLVQTKAKLNSTLSRATTSEFGKDPMFESSR